MSVNDDLREVQIEREKTTSNELAPTTIQHLKMKFISVKYHNSQ